MAMTWRLLDESDMIVREFERREWAAQRGVERSVDVFRSLIRVHYQTTNFNMTELGTDFCLLYLPRHGSENLLTLIRKDVV